MRAIPQSMSFDLRLPKDTVILAVQPVHPKFLDGLPSEFVPDEASRWKTDLVPCFMCHRPDPGPVDTGIEWVVRHFLIAPAFDSVPLWDVKFLTRYIDTFQVTVTVRETPEWPAAVSHLPPFHVFEITSPILAQS